MNNHFSFLKLFIYFFNKHKNRSIIMVVAMVFTGLADGMSFVTLLPLISMVVNDTGVPAEGLSLIIKQGFDFFGVNPSVGALLVLMFLFAFIKSIMSLFAMSQVGYTMAHVTTDLQIKCMRTFMTANWQFFVGNKMGVFTNAIGSEVGRSAQCFLSISRMLIAVVQVIIYLILALFISWEIAFAACTVGFISMLILSKPINMGRQAGTKQTDLQKSLMSRIIEAFSGMKPIKAMGLEARLIPLLHDELDGLRAIRKKMVLSRELISNLQEPIRVLAVVIGLYFLLDLWAGELEKLFVMAILFTRSVTRINNIQKSYHQVVTKEPAFWKLQDILNEAVSRQEVMEDSVSFKNNPDVFLRDVSFSYDEHIKVLDNISLNIVFGHFVAIVGPSGAGKTTVADLIIGLLKPSCGQVEIGGILLSEIDLREWRNRIGYVPQETFLFHESILVNVNLGDENITSEDVRLALEKSGAWDFVSRLPDGVNTIVGERGAKLSGGQRQRIAIARALARKPDLLILDEATTALDPKNEQAICKTLQELVGEVTILAISHQPALVEAAEHVYHLENGQLTVLKRPKMLG